jgi:hypothetical protein
METEMREHADSAGGSNGSAVQGLPLADDIVLAIAHGLFDAEGGGTAGAVAAWRYLDAQTAAAGSRSAAGPDYERVADHLAQNGEERLADFVRAVAAAGEAIRSGEERWRTRYVDRPPLSSEALAAALTRDTDHVDWDPAGPYVGVDGASYQPGGMTIGMDVEPVLVVTGRGAREVITGWETFGSMEQWIADRGSGGSRGLQMPLVPTMPRTWLEDAVLARMITDPQASAEAMRSLRQDTMTADVRYDIVHAMTRLMARNDGRYTPDQVAFEARRHLALVPGSGLERYGGADGPFIRTYVARLVETDIGLHEFRSSVKSLRMEDRQARERASVRAAGPRQRHEQEQRQPYLAQTPWPCPEVPSGHGHGPNPGYPEGLTPGR